MAVQQNSTSARHRADARSRAGACLCKLVVARRARGRPPGPRRPPRPALRCARSDRSRRAGRSRTAHDRSEAPGRRAVLDARRDPRSPGRRAMSGHRGRTSRARRRTLRRLSRPGRPSSRSTSRSEPPPPPLLASAWGTRHARRRGRGWRSRGGRVGTVFGAERLEHEERRRRQVQRPGLHRRRKEPAGGRQQGRRSRRSRFLVGRRSPRDGRRAVAHVAVAAARRPPRERDLGTGVLRF